MQIVEHLPLLAVLRDSRGKVLAVSAQLAAREGRRLVGRSTRKLWPDRAAEWLARDAEAIQRGEPVTALEDSTRGLLRTTRIPQPRKRCLWVAEDVGDSVRLAALRALLSKLAAPGSAPALSPTALMLLCGRDHRYIADALQVDEREALGLIHDLA